MRSFLSSHTHFLYCLAPQCSSGQIHEDDPEGNIFRCAACGFRMCTAHTPMIPFHETETCAQHNERVAEEQAEREAIEEAARIRREQDDASIAEVARSSVECPGCGANIQKSSGCDHMTCKFDLTLNWRLFILIRIGRRAGCRMEFCYVCRARYGGETGIRRIGNSAHAEECFYHSAKLPAHP
jgi:hypothetical protein